MLAVDTESPVTEQTIYQTQQDLSESLADIEGQEILLEVLERDGHDVSKQREDLDQRWQEYTNVIVGASANSAAANLSLERSGPASHRRPDDAAPNLQASHEFRFCRPRFEPAGQG